MEHSGMQSPIHLPLSTAPQRNGPLQNTGKQTNKIVTTSNSKKTLESKTSTTAVSKDNQVKPQSGKRSQV